MGSQVRVNRVLPKIRRDLLNLVVLQPEFRHLRAGPEIVRIGEPYRDPLFAQLDLDLLEVRAEFARFQDERLFFHIEGVILGVEFGVAQVQQLSPLIEGISLLDVFGNVTGGNGLAARLQIGGLLVGDNAHFLPDGRELVGLAIEAFKAVTTPAAFVEE